MAFTKAEIEAMPGDQVDEYVAEQVLGWTRAASVQLGGASIDEAAGAWLDQQGSGTVTRRDATTVEAPRYSVLPVATKTPDFSEKENVLDVLAAMVKAGYQAMLDRAGADFRASFVIPPASHGAGTVLASSNGADAVRRAALLAVQ